MRADHIQTIEAPNITKYLIIAGGVIAVLAIIGVIAGVVLTPGAPPQTVTPEPEPASNPIVVVNATPTPTATSTPTPEPVYTPTPIIDFDEEIYNESAGNFTLYDDTHRYVVITGEEPESPPGDPRRVIDLTPTPGPTLDNSIVVEATHDNPILIGDTAGFHVYVKTNDMPLHNVVIRFNASCMDREHKWLNLGYIPVQSERIISLPANSQTQRDLKYYVPEVLQLPDGTAFRVWATVYQFKIDLINEADGQIVGSTTLNNVQIVRMSTDGQGWTFDW